MPKTFICFNGQVSVDLLEEAAAMEDAQAYMEPPRLFQPIRHCLGYVQLNHALNFTAAEQARPFAPSAAGSSIETCALDLHAQSYRRASKLWCVMPCSG